MPVCREKRKADGTPWADSNAVCSGIKQLWSRCRQDKLAGMLRPHCACVPSPAGAARVDKQRGPAGSALGLTTAGGGCCRCCCLGTQPRPIPAGSQESFGAAPPCRTSRLDTEAPTRTLDLPPAVLCLCCFCSHFWAYVMAGGQRQPAGSRAGGMQAACIPTGLPGVSQTRELPISPLLPPTAELFQHGQHDKLTREPGLLQSKGVCC